MGDAWGQLIGTGLGLMLEGHNDARQLSQQKDLQHIQMQGAGQLNDMALQNWYKTNYSAQVEQMKKAGLNPGLMYAKGGPGGQMQQPAQPASATPQQNPGEIQQMQGLGIQGQLAAAQTELMKAQTKNIEADTAKKSGVDTQEGQQRITESQNRIQNLIQNTNNEKTKGNILQYEKDIAQINANVQQTTQQEIIDGIHAATRKIQGEAESSFNKGLIDATTRDNIINQITNNSQEQTLRIAAQKAGLIKTSAETNSINQGIQQIIGEIKNTAINTKMQWEHLDIQQQELAIKQALMKIQQQKTDFDTSTPEKIKQWTGIISDLLRTGPAFQKNLYK